MSASVIVLPEKFTICDRTGPVHAFFEVQSNSKNFNPIIFLKFRSYNKTCKLIRPKTKFFIGITFVIIYKFIEG